MKTKSVIPIYALYLSEPLLYILFSVDIIIKALIIRAYLKFRTCLNFTQIFLRTVLENVFLFF